MSDKEKLTSWETAGSQLLEDRALKEAAKLFGAELMPLVGIRGKVRRIAPTEQEIGRATCRERVSAVV